MSIGKNISELRKNRRLTQSELAKKLGVTEQSVSKWENDVCAPDVSIFPLLAKLFNVSIDRLYGFYLDSYDKEVQQILNDEADKAFGSPYEAVTYFEKALIDYPNSDKLKLALASAHFMVCRIEETEEKRTFGADKAISILYEVLGTSFNESILDEAYAMMARIYSETARYNQALKMLEHISGNGYIFKTIQKSQILADSKDYVSLRQYTESSLFAFYSTMDVLTSFYYNALYEQADYEQALRFCDLREKLLCLFDEGGNSLFSVNKMNNAFQKAHMLKKFGRKEECFQTLRYLVELANAALQLRDTAAHKVSFLNVFFGTVEEIEPHMLSADVKEYTLFMLSQFKDYFGGDMQFNGLLNVFDV